VVRKWFLGTVLVVSAVAQERASTVRTIRDVKVGMPRNVVVTGLAKNYEVRKILDDDLMVYGKDSDTFEMARIGFVQNRVFSVTTTLYPAMKGEAVRFAEHLFFFLRDTATLTPVAQKILQEPNVRQAVVEQVTNSKHLDLPVDLRYRRNDKLETMEIDFKVGEEHLVIEVSKLEGFPDSIEIQKYTDLLDDNPK
jgi:hypothetical protein